MMLGREKYKQQKLREVPELSAFEIEVAIEKLKRHIS